MQTPFSFLRTVVFVHQRTACSFLIVLLLDWEKGLRQSPTFIKCKQKYQSIVGYIGWLVQTTRPDLAPSHWFLSAYSNKPSRSHLNAALYVLHYIHSTFDYGFTFSSNAMVPLHTYMLFPHRSNTKAYVDAVLPKPGNQHRLTTYSDACWGFQIGKAIQTGIQLPLFKFWSMSGAILFCLGGPITWKVNRQDWTSLSLGEVEIQATNMGSWLTVNTRNLILDLSSKGYPITDAESATPVLMTTTRASNGAIIWWPRGIDISSIGRMSQGSGLRTAPFQSLTSAGSAIPLIYSPRKCAMPQISATFATLSWVVAPTSSNSFMHVSLNRSSPLHFTLRIQHTTSGLIDWAYSKLFYLTHRSVRPQPYCASQMRDDASSHGLVFLAAGPYEQLHGGYCSMILIPVIPLLTLAS